MGRRWTSSSILVLGLCSLALSGAAQHEHKAFDPDRIFKQTTIPVYGYEIRATHPHDTSSYTEGLVMFDGALYEGTGLWGQSSLRRNEMTTGDALEEVSLSPDQFG